MFCPKTAPLPAASVRCRCYSHPKGPFIATQLNSTRRRVEFSWVQLRRYRHPDRRNSTVAGDRQCNWPSCMQRTANQREAGH